MVFLQAGSSPCSRLYLLLLSTTSCKRKFAISSNSSDFFSCDNLPASTLDKVVTFAGEVVFERKPPPLHLSRRRVLANGIDLRISGQPEEPYLLNGREATFLMSSLMKQVLNSSHKSTIITDWINKDSQKNAEQIEYYPLSHKDSVMPN